jgi:putative toxin-antitoxin system antitoxin component (TIGR02293 family)
MSARAKLPENKDAAYPGQGRKSPPAPPAPTAPTIRRAPKAAMRAASPSTGFEQVFLTAPHERIAAIKRGVPAAQLNVLAERMQIPKEAIISLLRLSRATVNRKARDSKPLSQDESERVLGVEYLIGQVENMVKESGAPQGFDAALWVAAWLHAPLPALGNQPPASYMDTVEGQKLVSAILAMAQSGAYA